MIGLDALFTRRSIRKYRSEPVKDDDIRKLLMVGMAAPTGGNRKPWHFIVVKKRETLDELAERHPYGKMLFEAPLCIAVCGDPAISPLPRSFIREDCSAATMNILHGAVALGLGAVWIGLAHPDQASMAREVLSIPDDIVPANLIAVGYPAEEKEPRTQFDESRVHQEKW
ncbi:MAG: nitroreductase family protein [Candidatus Bathyarchaeota archaeon]|nr:nitroreductase family protein [Candidatus Bathyarchaeota archaeon]